MGAYVKIDGGLKKLEKGFIDRVNVENLTANKTLTASDAPVQMYTSNGSYTVTLPTTGLETGQKFEIWNINPLTSTYYVLISAGSLQYYLSSGNKVTLRWSGSEWKIEYGNTISIGSGNGNYSNGVSVGANTNNNYNYGVGVGYNAQNNYNYGVGVGSYAQSNSYGVGVGSYAQSNNNYGVGVGLYAQNNYSYGVGVGSNAQNNYNYGVGVGSYAQSNNNYGVGVGLYAQNNYSYGVGVGSYTTTQGKGAGTVALGAHSKAERTNEFVTTGSQSTTNKAQFSVCKYREKDLSSNGGAWQEVFLDAVSARLTILAGSVVQFCLYLNALGSDGTVKCWKLEGVIKRPTGGNVAIVGTVSKTVIAEDTGTTNWDVQITADTTNQALKIEVKHDSASNVRFSSNCIITETRL